MRFDLVDLRLFLNVVEAGSITAGAARSHLSLPSASARIRGMEDSLGTRLLERERLGIRPTEAGRLLLDHARLLLAQAERMRGDLAGYATGLRAELRLAANTAPAGEHLPDPLAGFLAAHPHLDIDLTVQPSERVMEAVLAGAADLGVAAVLGPPPPLHMVPFRTDRLVVIVPAGHVLAGRTMVPFEAVLAERLVGLVPGSALRSHLDGQAARLGGRFATRVCVGDFAAMCRLVRQGVAPGIVPLAAARRHDVPPDHIIPLQDPWAVRALMVCVRRADGMPPLLRRLFDHLAAPAPRH